MPPNVSQILQITSHFLIHIFEILHSVCIVDNIVIKDTNRVSVEYWYKTCHFFIYKHIKRRFIYFKSICRNNLNIFRNQNFRNLLFSASVSPLPLYKACI